MCNQQIKTQQLFWKVWKNRYISTQFIFPLIKSNNRQGVYNYDQITSVEWILTYGHKGLLIDKVYTCSHLDFYKPFGNKSSLELIFKDAQLKENNKFLLKLFSNYQHYFNPSIRECINISIQCDCKNAFIILLNKIIEMNLYGGGGDSISSISSNDGIKELVIQLFKYSIYQNSFTIGLYLNEIYSGLIKNELFSNQDKCNEFWKDLLLFNKELVDEDDSKTMDINQRVDFLVNSLNVQLPTIGIQEFYYLYSINIEDILLIDLVHCNLVLDKLKLIFKQYYIDNPPKSCSITNSIFKIINGNNQWSINNILSYDQLIKMEFTNKELYTTVKYINSCNKNVELMFINLLPFTKNPSVEKSYGFSFKNHQFQSNFYFYQNKYKLNSPKLQVQINSNSYLYGNYENVKLNSEWKNKDSSKTIFENVKYEIEIQIKFIDNAISDILNQSIPINNKYTLDTLYCYLLEFNSLNLIKFLFKQFKNNNKLVYGNNNNDDKSIYCQFSGCKIKSIEIFDYLFKKYRKEIGNYPIISLDNLLSNSSNSIILNHFKNKYNQQYLESLKLTFGNTIINNSKQPISVLLFICENIQDFKDHFNLISDWLEISLYTCYGIQVYKTIVQALISIGQSYKCNFGDFGLFEFQLEHGKILNWVIESRSNDIKSGICKFNFTEIPLIYYYFHNEFNEKLQTTSLQYLKRCDLKILLHQISKVGDIIAMELLFNRFIQFELDYFTFDSTKRTPNDNYLSELRLFKKKCLHTVISSASEFGKVELLSFILNHLKNQSPSSHCSVEFDFSLVKYQVYINGNIRLSQFLISNNQVLSFGDIENTFLLNYLNSIKKI